MSYNTANKSIPNECVIDIRLPSEWYETGVLEGSHLITFLMASGAVNPLFVHEVKKLFDKDDKIVLMCHSGKRTKLAMEVLKNAGFSDVSDIEGGIYNYSRLGAKLVEYKGQGILDFCGVLGAAAPKDLGRSPYKICEAGQIYLA